MGPSPLGRNVRRAETGAFTRMQGLARLLGRSRSGGGRGGAASREGSDSHRRCWPVSAAASALAMDRISSTGAASQPERARTTAPYIEASGRIASARTRPARDRGRRRRFDHLLRPAGKDRPRAVRCAHDNCTDRCDGAANRGMPWVAVVEVARQAGLGRPGRLRLAHRGKGAGHVAARGPSVSDTTASSEGRGDRTRRGSSRGRASRR